MLDVGFYWNCPNCKRTNWENTADDYRDYSCQDCKKKYQLSFNVEVDEIEPCEEEEEYDTSVRLETIDVSKDDGKSWEEMTINTRNLNPTTADVEPGWLLKYKDSVYKVLLHAPSNRLLTEKISA